MGKKNDKYIVSNNDKDNIIKSDSNAKYKYANRDEMLRAMKSKSIVK